MLLAFGPILQLNREINGQIVSRNVYVSFAEFRRVSDACLHSALWAVGPIRFCPWLGPRKASHKQTSFEGDFHLRKQGNMGRSFSCPQFLLSACFCPGLHDIARKEAHLHAVLTCFSLSESYPSLHTSARHESVQKTMLSNVVIQPTLLS